MALTQINVKELTDLAVRGEINIPELQRDFVWDRGKVKALAESLFRKYPIGMILLWMPEEDSTVKARGHVDSSQSHRWIIDGQQRITALCLLRGVKPYWWQDTDKWKLAEIPRAASGIFKNKEEIILRR